MYNMCLTNKKRLTNKQTKKYKESLQHINNSLVYKDDSSGKNCKKNTKKN